jgi:two-component system chemotaxis response regulator CheB
MERHPVPVLMVSSLTMEGAKETMTALELGAVDYIPKQLDGMVTNISTIRQELISKVIVAAGAAGKLKRLRTGSTPAPVTTGRPALTVHSTVATRGSKVVAIGCSTGGPQALAEILPMLPEDFPAGIVIVQHMPKFFTKPFAERMNQLCRITVREAAEADVVAPGVALIAPGGLQFRLVRSQIQQVQVALAPNTEGFLHAPSVDVMMQSVAQLYGERGIGVILTGMGQDGLDGMRAIKESKGRTVAQDETTSTVYGMPKAVVEKGYADKVVPLSHIAGEIINMV